MKSVSGSPTGASGGARRLYSPPRMKEGDVVGGRFEIGPLAGSGGMGAVHRAVDRASDGRGPAAVKVLWAQLVDLPEHAERFAREARVLQELSHPGIVRY